MKNRALIDRLFDLAAMAVDQALELDYGDPEDHYIYRELNELRPFARAAVNHDEPDWPTDEQVMALMTPEMREDFAEAARSVSVLSSVPVQASGIRRVVLNRHAVDLALMVLARWGRDPADAARAQQPKEAEEQLHDRDADALDLVRTRWQAGLRTSSVDLAQGLGLRGDNALRIARRALKRLADKGLLHQTKESTQHGQVVWFWPLALLLPEHLEKELQ